MFYPLLNAQNTSRKRSWLLTSTQVELRSYLSFVDAFDACSERSKRDRRGGGGSRSKAESAPNERRVMEFPVVTASRVLATMLKDGSLRGEFRIEVAIVDAVYGDDTSGIDSREHAILIRAANWRNSASSPIEISSYADPSRMEGGSCQDQTCKWAQAGCYQCEGGAGFGCQVNGCNSCTETRCPGLE